MQPRTTIATTAARRRPGLHLDVAFYDQAHREALEHHQAWPQIEAVVRDGITVDPGEFAIHTIFTEQKPHDGWRTHQDLKERLPDRLPEFRDYFDLTHGTVRSKFDAEQTGSHRVEKIGVAGGILVMNEIFGLHEADWQKIPDSRVKDLDFSLAATDSLYVELEAKGTIVEDVTRKDPGISQKKAQIEAKKRTQRAVNNTSALFGVIVAVPSAGAQNARCWLLAPPSRNVSITLRHP